MKILHKVTNERVASVYVADFGGGRLAEFVESVQPPKPVEKKWVLIVSTLFGCPVGCPMCDAGGDYKGQLSEEELLAQIDFLVRQRFGDGPVRTEQFKIQMARMGEPALNPNVPKVLAQLPQRYGIAGLMPAVSTVAPAGCEKFFADLLAVKKRLYGRGKFQLQFSIHSTDATTRDRLIPIRKWTLARIAAYGEEFFQPGDRKITLNFALGRDVPLEGRVLKQWFDPTKFLVKITPINPTYRGAAAGLASHIDAAAGEDQQDERCEAVRDCGYEVILSVGELEENRIGSNCGQYVQRHLRATTPMEAGYDYPVEKCG